MAGKDEKPPKAPPTPPPARLGQNINDGWRQDETKSRPPPPGKGGEGQKKE